MPDEPGSPDRRHDRDGGELADHPTEGSAGRTAAGHDAETIALFPLGMVLVPGAALPIHVFERRYREMLADLNARAGADDARHASPCFGVVMLTRGTETGRDIDVAEVGTLAEIVEQQGYPDGTCDLLTIGSRRFRVLQLDRTSRPYLQARVEWLTEDEGELPGALLLGARALCQEYGRVLAQLSARSEGDAPARDPLKLSYEIAQRLHLHTGERQALLAAPTIGERLRFGSMLLRREITVLQRTRSVPVSTKALLITPAAN